MNQNLFSKIPEKIKLNLLKNEQEEDNKNRLTEEEKNLLKINKNYLESKLWNWKKDENFEFSLPPTIFTNKIIIRGEDDLRYRDQGIQYENPNIVGQRFSPEILEQIWQKGEFTINSTEPELPYTWKLSALTIKGIQNVKYRYRKDMSISFFFFYSLYYRFSSYKYKKLFPLSFHSSIYHLYYTFYQLLQLFFGLPLYSHNEYEIELKIKHQRLLDFIRANNDLDFSFFMLKSVQNLKKFDEEFDSKWINEIEPRLIKNYKEQKLNTAQIKTNLSEDKKREFLEFLNENNQKFKEFEDMHPSTKDYLSSQQIINDVTFYSNLEKEQKIENYEKELKKNYIRDLCKLWHNDKMSAYNEKITKETEDEKEKKIKRDIQNKKDPSSVYYYNTNNNKEIPDLVKEEQKREREPYEIFKIKRYLTKPYEKYQEENNNGEIRYNLRKVTYHKVKTSFFFWRVILYLVKFFCSFCNFNIVIYRQMIDSMFGIKALFLCELYRDYEIDYYNGKISKVKKTYTFPRSISNLFVWVIESRKNFESAPDTGILGKGCTRIFHLFLNYILRLFCLGVLLIIFYPTFIIINIFTCLCLIILSPLLITLWTILDFFFCLIIYNRYDLLKCFPLLRIIIVELLIGFVIQITFSILSVVIQPLLSIFFFIYSQIHFILRFIYDLFFYFIFKCLGKVPETNNCIAWVIGGPGLFRDRYYDIKNKDILSLVIGELEKRIMNNYEKKMEKILEAPNDTIRDIQKIYNKIGLRYETNSAIISNISYYKKKLREKIRDRNLYPECYINVKFTEERITDVKNMVELYITEYSKTKDISFELDKWEEKKVENLAKEIMEKIFGKNIFEPLQSTDKIVHLQSIFKNELDEITTKIFENPMYNDKIYVEERPNTNIIVRLPVFANFKQIFYGDLNLDLSHLKQEEKENLLKKEDLLIIRT